MFNRICQLALIGVIILSFAGFLGKWHLVLELASHFRVQYYLISSALLVYFVITQHWRWVTLSLLPLAINGFFIFSWFVPLEDIFSEAVIASEAKQSRVSGKLNGIASSASGLLAMTQDLRILVANVEMENVRYSQLIETVQTANADIVVLPETDFKWVKAIEHLKEHYPYQSLRPREDFYGMSLFSRYPIEALSDEGAGLEPIYSHVFKIKLSQKSLTLIAVHTAPPVSLGWFEIRNREYERIARWARDLPKPLMVIGDLNTSPWSPFYRRLLKDSGLTNARKGFGVMPTWPAFLLAEMRIPLDHCLISSDLQVTQIRTGKPYGSDHLPLVVDVKLIN